MELLELNLRWMSILICVTSSKSLRPIRKRRSASCAYLFIIPRRNAIDKSIVANLFCRYFYAMIVCLVIVATVRDYFVKTRWKGTWISID